MARIEFSTGLIILDLVAKLNKTSIDIRQIERQYSIYNREISIAEFIRAAKHSGLKTRHKKSNNINSVLSGYPLPVVCLLKNGSFGAVLQKNKEQLLFFDGLTKKTIQLSINGLSTKVNNEFIVIKKSVITKDIRFGISWFINEIKSFRQVISEVLLGSFVIQLFALVTPLLVQVILDKVLTHQSMTTLNVLAVAFVAIMIFELLLNISRNYIFIHTSCKLDARLGSKLFNHLFTLPYAYFENRKVGNIISRVRELDKIRDFITNKSVTLLLDSFFAIVFFVVMLFYSKSLSFISLAFISVVALMYALITPSVRTRLEEKFQMSAESNSYLVESVTGIQTVKALAVEGSMQRKWENLLAKYIHAGFNLSIVQNIASALVGLIQKGMTVVILYIGVKLVLEQKMTVGQLIAFNMISRQLTAPVVRLAGLWHEVQQTFLAIDRLGDILNHPQEKMSGKSITLPQVKGQLIFENVNFRYNINQPWIINNLNLSIKAGHSIGFVGKSGSGKSTIAKLVQRLYLSQEGSIYLDGVDLKHLHPQWLRYQFGVVLQENYLFSGTVRDNISIARPDVTIDSIIEVSNIAGAHEFISKMPEGYETMVGERGTTLSGGQKQRIAIARALLTNPKILILDEATSALDYESEKIINDNLKKITHDRTTLIIAHRLSTVRNCDILIVMDEGKIVEQGSHDELLSKKGYYYNLYSQQMGDQKDA